MSCIALFLLKRGLIEKGEVEEYIYGTKILSLKICHFAIYIVLGIIFDCFLDMMLFFLLFRFFRKQTSGLHTKNPISCFYITLIIGLVNVFVCHMNQIYLAAINTILWIYIIVFNRSNIKQEKNMCSFTIVCYFFGMMKLLNTILFPFCIANLLDKHYNT